MRLGVNINGKGLDRLGISKFVEDYNPEWALVSDNEDLATELLYTVSAAGNVISRNTQIDHNNDWRTTSPHDYASVLTMNHDKRLWLYLLDSPVVHKADIRHLGTWLCQVIQELTDKDYKIVVGNFPVNLWDTWELEQGGLDSLLTLLHERRDVLKLGVKEYTGVVLPFGAGKWGKWDMLDRSKMQKEWWPTYEHSNVSYQLEDPHKSKVTAGQHLMRSMYLQYRAVDILGLDRLKMLVTDFGWNRPTDMTTGANHIFDALVKRYGFASGYNTLDGANTLENVWKHYWPEWSKAKAIVEQLKWVNDFYNEDYIGILPLMITNDPEEVAKGLNYGSDPKVQKLLIEYAIGTPIMQVEEAPEITTEPEIIVTTSNEPEPFNWALADDVWEKVWLTSTSEAGTYIRHKPYAESSVIGLVQKDTPALLIPSRPLNDEEYNWYSVRTNANANATHDNGDFSNVGWIRGDVFTYKKVIVPEQGHSAESNRRFEIIIDYNSLKQEDLAVVEIIKKAVSLLSANSVKMMDLEIVNLENDSEIGS